MITRTQALELLHLKMQNQNLRRHCYCVEAAMRGLYRKLGNKDNSQKSTQDEERWGIVGLLHDGDYEFTKTNPGNHARLMADWVRELGETDEELLTGIESHGWFHAGLPAGRQGKLPETQMQWSLFCCDELTGLIIATALVQPTRKLTDVTVEKVLKKFPEKNFAAGAKRGDIKMCEEHLKIPLNQFIEIVLVGMQSIAAEIGL